MKFKLFFITIFSLSLFTNNCLGAADENTASLESVKDKSVSVKVEQVLDEYKSYVSTLPKEVREEVINYRKEIAKLNRQKREMYKRLSSEAQGHLAKEQEFRKKLPLNQKNLLNDKIDNSKKEN